MEPFTVGVLAASLIVGLAGAALAGLKAWSGWLDLKKMELAQLGGDGFEAFVGAVLINEHFGVDEAGEDAPAASDAPAGVDDVS